MVRDLSRAKSMDSQVSEERQNAQENEDKKKGELVKDEEREEGDVDWAMYKLYIGVSGGFIALFFVIVSLCFNYGTGQGANFWLAEWSNDNNSDDPSHGNWYYMGFYASIQFVAVIGLFISCTILLVNRLKASKILHERLLERMLHAPMYFFDTTPIGRILNRFSKDIYNVDQAVPSSWASYIR